MSFFKRALTALGLRKEEDWIAMEGDRLVFRELSKAKTLPLEPAQMGPKHMGVCERCESPVRQVVFTTAGAGPQADVWRAYPLAMDGWVCSACGWSAAPRRISADEATEYGRRGAEHAENGEFDDAEFWFRRIISSWPGYHAGYADLGQLMSSRASAVSDGDDRERYRREAVRWFDRAIAADPDCSLPGIRTPFARVLALTGDEERANELLGAVLSEREVPEEVRSEASALLGDIRDGRALFTRATEILGHTVLEPPAKPLSPSHRSAMERGRALLIEAAGRKASFGTLFFLGKSELRLRNFTAARDALQAAVELEPDQADGVRELTSAYLEMERAAEALPLAKRAVELRPGDPTLHCNLAVVLLLTGDVGAARATAEVALEQDPGDAITRRVLRIVEDVSSGQRRCPRSLAELEGRR